MLRPSWAVLGLFLLFGACASWTRSELGLSTPESAPNLAQKPWPGTSTEAKSALLIANGNYRTFPSLANPVSEARQLKTTLERLGFRVTLLTDLSRDAMMQAVVDFGEELNRAGGIALFHYGGHAVQVNGENYLIPTDARIQTEAQVGIYAMNLNHVLTTLEQCQSTTNLIILDSCRDNPLPAASRGATRGLSPVGKKPKNSMIVFSAESGSTAQDGVFTPALIRNLALPEDFSAIVRQTRADVSRQTSGTQVPGAYDQLIEEVYLGGFTAAPRTSGFQAAATGALGVQLAATGQISVAGQEVNFPRAGRVEVDQLPVGSVQVTATYPDGHWYQKWVTVVENRVTEVVFDYAPTPQAPKVTLEPVPNDTPAPSYEAPTAPAETVTRPAAAKNYSGRYQVAVLQVNLSGNLADGSVADALSDPDLVLTLFHNSEVIATYPMQKDVLAVRFTGNTAVDLRPGDTLTIKAEDNDLTKNDLIGRRVVTWDTLTQIIDDGQWNNISFGGVTKLQLRIVK